MQTTQTSRQKPATINIVPTVEIVGAHCHQCPWIATPKKKGDRAHLVDSWPLEKSSKSYLCKKKKKAAALHAATEARKSCIVLYGLVDFILTDTGK